MLLSYSLYAFSESMLAEYRAIRLNIQVSQQQQVAHSGIEVARHQLSSRNNFKRSQFEYFLATHEQSIGMIDGLNASFVFRHQNGTSRQLSPGMENESGKLNINSLPLQLSRADEARARLTALPGIDLRIADSILDWLDDDDNTRPAGAETSFYSQLGYRPRQGQVQSLGELLRVRGITPELLFGEDKNANSWLDANENDGDISAPRDNADDILDRGLSAWITVNGAESTLDENGSPKININGKRLDELYDALLPRLGKRAAQFVVAYRLEGPLRPSRLIEMDAKQRMQRRLETAEARLRKHLGIETPFENPGSEFKDTFRAGIDMSRTGSYQIESLLDLFGARVLATINTKQEILESPWEQNAPSLQATLGQLESILTTTPGLRRIDRINPVSAPREVLLTIPGFGDGQVNSIVQTRHRILANASAMDRFHSIAWLVTEAGLSFEHLQKAAPYLTAGGDRFRGFALGRLDGSSNQSVLSFVLDATEKTPVTLRTRTWRSIPRVTVRPSSQN